MNRNKILIGIIKVALLCLIVIGVAGLICLFWIIPREIRTPEVAVPNLAGQSYQRAVQLLNSAGLQLDPNVEKKPNAEFPEGYVIEQEPPADFNVKKNKPVRLTVSMGNEAVAVPDVTGKHLNEADKTLKDIGFRRGRVGAVHSDRYPEINTVIAQTPRAASTHQRGGTVHLLLSLGVRAKVLQMPDLRHMQIDEVRALLESHGLKIGEQTYKPHGTISQGLIIDHQPTIGELVPIGTIVDLNISGSRRIQTDKVRAIPIAYRVSETGAPSKRVRIEVEDERGKSIEVLNESYQSGMLIEKPPLRVIGKAVMRVYENGQLVKTEEFDW